MAWLLLALAVGLAMAAVVASRRLSGRSRVIAPPAAPPAAPPRFDPAARLAAHFADRRDYRVYVEVPALGADEWLRAAAATGGAVTLADGRQVPGDRVRAYVVAYPNGEVADGHDLFAPLPDGVHMKDFGADTGTLPPTAPREWERGRRFARVSHDGATLDPTQPACLRYRTTLRNVGREPFRVLHFGPYAPERDGLAPGKRYTADDFVQWYGTAPEGWVAPGQAVCDANNWGAPGVTWAYFCVTAGGTHFVVADKSV